MNLSNREMQILKLAGGEGLGYKQIAGNLCISKETVAIYARRARIKLGAKTLAHAVHKAWELDILPGENDEDATG